jgi:deazaflavin-dependent oxidoreductase (nitroreductase family)
MPVELTPRGTYGARTPKGMPAPVMKLMRVGMSLVSTFMRMRGLNVITLTTVGARSGQQRTTDLLAVPDGPDAWIIAASFAGAAQHPAWYFNIARHPDQIWLSDRKRRVRVDATTLHGDAAKAGYDRLIAMYKGYAAYPTKTDREIPVVRLTVVE